jgi:AAA domain
MLDASSPRYRDVILSRSTARGKKEVDWFSSITIPTAGEIGEIEQGLDSLLSKRLAANEARSALEASSLLLQKHQTHTADAERRLSAFREESGITPEHDQRLDDLTKTIEFTSTVRAQIIGREHQLEFAWKNRTHIETINQLSTERQLLVYDLNQLRSKEAHAEGRIARAKELEAEIRQKKSRNAQIDVERAATSGIWGWLDKNVFTWKDDIEQLETVRRGIDVGEEREHLRVFVLSQGQGIRRQEEIQRRLQSNLKMIAIGSLPAADQQLRLADLTRDLGAASILLSIYGGFEAATYLLHWDKLVSLTFSRKQCQGHLLAVQEQEERARLMLKLAGGELNSVEGKRFVERFRDICPADFMQTNPGHLPDARLRSDISRYWHHARLRHERAPMVQDALRIYHKRLNTKIIDLEDAIVVDADIIAATCTGIATAKRFQGDFDCVIVDEAGKAAPLDLLIPMIRGKSVVLVGDHRQLPPLLDHDIIKDLQQGGWDASVSTQSLFEQLFVGSHLCRKSQLALQYRMVPPICRVVKELSYWDLALEPAGVALKRHHPFTSEFACAVHWISCEGPKNRAMRRGGTSGSPENEAEAEAIVNCLQRLASGLDGVSDPYKVGVISMYSGQVARIRREVARAKIDPAKLSIEQGTVDAFQGRQRDAIIVSLVETDPDKRAFFYDIRRLNVALSRARDLLIVVGSVDKLGKSRLSPFKDTNPMHSLNQIFEESGRMGELKKETYSCK